MDDCIDSIEKIAVLSTLETNSSYWQVEGEETDSDKTTFTSHYKLYRLVQMPF